MYDGCGDSIGQSPTQSELLVLLLQADRLGLICAAEAAARCILEMPIDLKVINDLLSLPDNISQADWFQEIQKAIESVCLF